MVLETNPLLILYFLEMITSRSTIFLFAVSVLYFSSFPPIMIALK